MALPTPRGGLIVNSMIGGSLPHVVNVPEGNTGHNWKASDHIKRPPCCSLTAISQGASGLLCIFRGPVLHSLQPSVQEPNL